jgi:hypothetical protein
MNNSSHNDPISQNYTYNWKKQQQIKHDLILNHTNNLYI